jgi:hypothetical protein
MFAVSIQDINNNHIKKLIDKEKKPISKKLRNFIKNFMK